MQVPSHKKASKLAKRVSFLFPSVSSQFPLPSRTQVYFLTILLALKFAGDSMP
jgi:hypothetical protein